MRGALSHSTLWWFITDNMLWAMVKDRGAWHAAVRSVLKSWTRMSDWTSKCRQHFKCLPCSVLFIPQAHHNYLMVTIHRWKKREGNRRKKTVKGLVPQSCLTLRDPMDCSPPGSSAHGILQARILEWGVLFFTQEIFPTQGSNLGLLPCRQILYHQGSP